MFLHRTLIRAAAHNPPAATVAPAVGSGYAAAWMAAALIAALLIAGTPARPVPLTADPAGTS